MGLFAANHMPYHLDANSAEVPTVEEMLQVAMNILEKQSQGKGYFLFVEGGRIDHAHHDTLAMKALDETAEFAKAIEYARKKTNLQETLIVVTSDHSHTMSVAGYSSRKNDIFGVNNAQLALDQLPYATLSYANGPVPLESETHGGDDVAVFASGPFAHLFTGVYEQNFIPHAMGYASCLGKNEQPVAMVYNRQVALNKAKCPEVSLLLHLMGQLFASIE
ncbi:Alkaline phosphatase, tissue-nonspecific isozyme [Eumeta japonica]|uniref:alkaline phosphatase n=1 Tax=Eumeta variegata TaxID=151549 RepID=A0A4C1SQ08_EUMVA|nr:Alkaline phosphatase, tissue-nonspecific isozyme [Eumeta japonica]